MTVPVSLSGALSRPALPCPQASQALCHLLWTWPSGLGASRCVCFCCRGHKRKLNEEDAASESSGASSCEDEEGGSSEADEMAAALEAELGDLM